MSSDLKTRTRVLKGYKSTSQNMRQSKKGQKYPAFESEHEQLMLRKVLMNQTYLESKPMKGLNV